VAFFSSRSVTMAERRLAIVASHPIQYHAPLHRELARRFDLTVFFAHRATGADQARAGFGVAFDWDADLLAGFRHVFLYNVARVPGPHHFAGCDTPDLRRALEQGEFDALLVHGWHLKSYVQAILYARKLGLPVMARGDSQLDTRRSWLKRAAKAAAYPFLLRRFDAGLFVGAKSRDYWRHYDFPESRLFFSPHCVDTRWFESQSTAAVRAEQRRQLGARGSELILLFAGKLIDLKRPVDIVEAIARLRSEGLDASLLVAGSGPLQPLVEAKAAALEVPVRFLGFCNQSKMPAAYAAADLLVLPSAEESWGLVANEALACGTPILLSDRVGAAPDLAADGKAGAVFPCGNIQALADAAGRLLARPPSGAQIAARSARYSPQAAADGVEHAVAAVARLGPKQAAGRS
jgi:glycosyltransferase involved in cell wall biosynthesis